MRILITGSAGFVGKEMVKYLKTEGHYIIGIDINEETQSDEFYKHDLTIQFNKEINFDICFHLASSVGGILFNTEKADMITYNNLLNKNILYVLNNNNCKRLVFFSSINVFEGEKDFPHEKLKGITQTSGYALSKAIGEIFFSSWIEDLLIIRPTNIFGKSQIRCHDKFGESHVIPDLIKKIDISTGGMEVFGDGTQIRNFIHVTDIINFLKIKLDFKGQNYINLRSDILITIGELTKELISISGKEIKIKYIKEYMKYEQMKISNFDISIPKQTGFSLKINTIKEGLLI